MQYEVLDGGRRARSLDDDGVPDADCAAREDLRAQPAAVDERLTNPLAPAELLHVGARLAQAQPFHPRRPDAEFPAHEVVEGHTARHDVPPDLPRGNGDSNIAVSRLHRLRLNEGELPVSLV